MCLEDVLVMIISGLAIAFSLGSLVINRRTKRLLLEMESEDDEKEKQV